MRLDQYLVAAGHFQSRARAQGAIAAGLVAVDGSVSKKASLIVAQGTEISVAGDVHPYVSRGGVKLEAALAHFGFDPAGLVCLDLGASTGGFCDVLLRRGAARIYAVDVGNGQLHEKIAGDRRVVKLENTHAKNLTRALVPDPVSLLVCDVSFISLRKALPPALALCAEDAAITALIKPQFEIGRARLGKGGLVIASAEEIAVMVEGMKDWIAAAGWRVLGVIESPITGGDGNQEFLLGAVRRA